MTTIIVFSIILSPIITFTFLIMLESFTKKESLRVRMMMVILFLSILATPYFAAQEYVDHNDQRNRIEELETKYTNDEFGGA